MGSTIALSDILGLSTRLESCPCLVAIGPPNKAFYDREPQSCAMRLRTKIQIIPDSGNMAWTCKVASFC
jgi:hypothetical protein